MTSIKIVCKKINSITGEKFPTKKEFASFANRLLTDYCKKFHRTLETIDHDEFFTKYIGVDIQYQRLSRDKSILGVTIQKDGYIETYNEDGTIKWVETHRGDIFIDSEACGSLKRELFTMYNELKHCLCDLDKDFRVDKIIDGNEVIDGEIKPKTELGWAEFFANYFAACAVLPRRKLKKIYAEKHEKYFGSFHTRVSEKRIWVLKNLIKEISDETEVSQSAIAIRLKELKFISEGIFKALNFKYGKEAAMLFRYKRR